MKLIKITEDNFVKAAKLTTNQNGIQGMSETFVMSNLFSIAQMQFLPDFNCYGIMDDEEMVGLVMYGLEDDNPWIYRFMIDINFQGRGLGKRSMSLIIETIIKEFAKDVLFISLDPENTIARKLYESLGFIDTGRIEEGECVLSLSTTLA